MLFVICEGEVVCSMTWTITTVGGDNGQCPVESLMTQAYLYHHRNQFVNNLVTGA